MERYVDGDIRAFEELYSCLRPLLVHMLVRWLSKVDSAEDALQITMLRIHQSRSRYRRGAPVLPWACTIARHVAIDHLRSSARRERPAAEEEIERAADASAELYTTEKDEAEIVAAVRAAIESLPESSRELIRAHKLDGRSMSEAAQMIGVKEGAARVRAHRAYKLLATKLSGLRARRG